MKVFRAVAAFIICPFIFLGVQRLVWLISGADYDPNDAAHMSLMFGLGIGFLIALWSAAE